ncbi:MAG: metallophosphoesterase family protein [Pirellulaceae bacterium]
MKMLLFSDVHCDATAARRLVAAAERVDVVVGAGDFASARNGLGELTDTLRLIDRPIVLVAGNAETHDELTEAWQGHASAHVLHGSGCRIQGVSFWGVGGAIPVTPFGSWSFDLTEEEGAALLEPCPPGAVLVTHAPPFGLLDHGSRGISIGSRSILATIERCRPPLVVCGHVHACSGRTLTYQESIVINAGPRGVVHVLRSRTG